MNLTEREREETVVKAMEQFGEEIKRVIFTYIKNYSAVDDVFQEVFLKVYKQLHLFRGDSSLKTWIYRIAINTCKDYLRSFKYRLHSWMQPNVDELTESSVVREEERQELAALVLRLPLKYREVLILHYYRDFSVEEIGLILGSNKNTVKTRLKRGREKVKEMMMEGGSYFEEGYTFGKQKF
ncbi:sigma-70 family RNA polymerase sigma factor [Sutcliffiella deserti]|uniref:sigma-70 family RNA polymerase sigma factor n=1 Tax=Sutcliffiella deserti TaxID=2875501 RepID=UPI001CBC0951|nr:sigma-70 family RNA polymerase sigma factor [Sutcliffiella deserti]